MVKVKTPFMVLCLFFSVVACLFISCAGGASGGDSEQEYATLSLGLGTSGSGARSASPAPSIFAGATVDFELISTEGSYHDNAVAVLDSQGQGSVGVKRVPVGAHLHATANVTAVDGTVYAGESDLNVGTGNNVLNITVKMSAGAPLIIDANATVTDVEKKLAKMESGKTYTVKFVGTDGNLSILSAIKNVASGINIELNMSDSTVAALNADLFSGCTSITSVSLPATLESIGDRAFKGCSSLGSIDMGMTDVDYIGPSAFEGCTSLASVDLPYYLSSISERTFYGCTSLASIDMNVTIVDTIGTSAFEGCSSLASVDIYRYTKKIGSSAFADCTSLTSFPFVSTINDIYNDAWRGCTSLTSFASIPNKNDSDGDWWCSDYSNGYRELYWNSSAQKLYAHKKDVENWSDEDGSFDLGWGHWTRPGWNG